MKDLLEQVTYFLSTTERNTSSNNASSTSCDTPDSQVGCQSIQELTDNSSGFLRTILKLKGYGLGPELGRGTFATVRKGRSLKSKSKYAIKIVDCSKAPEDFITRFFPRELSIIRKLKHENVVNVIDVFKIHWFTCILMDRACGGDILDYLIKNGPMDDTTASQIFKQTVFGLRYCHEMSIAHRDIKCENVLLTADMKAKLADFGFAREVMKSNSTCVLSETYCGSVGYAAPEVLSCRPYNPFIADIWSMGVLLYMMVCSVMPFDDTVRKKMVSDQKTRHWGFSSERRAAISPNCRTIIRSLLEPDITYRPSLCHLLSSPWLSKVMLEDFVGDLAYKAHKKSSPDSINISNIDSNAQKVKTLVPDYLTCLQDKEKGQTYSRRPSCDRRKLTLDEQKNLKTIMEVYHNIGKESQKPMNESNAVKRLHGSRGVSHERKQSKDSGRDPHDTDTKSHNVKHELPDTKMETVHTGNKLHDRGNESPDRIKPLLQRKKESPEFGLLRRRKGLIGSKIRTHNPEHEAYSVNESQDKRRGSLEVRNFLLNLKRKTQGKKNESEERNKVLLETFNISHEKRKLPLGIKIENNNQNTGTGNKSPERKILFFGKRKDNEATGNESQGRRNTPFGTRIGSLDRGSSEKAKYSLDKGMEQYDTGTEAQHRTKLPQNARIGPHDIGKEYHKETNLQDLGKEPLSQVKSQQTEAVHDTSKHLKTDTIEVMNQQSIKHKI